MAQRRGWRTGPTDVEGDVAELRHTEAADDDDNFDTPSVEQVLQAETGMPDRPIPVRLVNPVNVNQLPTRLSAMFSKAIAASPAPAIKVLNADPRRAAVTIALGGSNSFVIGRSQAEAADADAFVVVGNQGPYKFHFTDELWVRCTGAASRVSIAVEQWAR
jgi:hypothetical protein